MPSHATVDPCPAQTYRQQAAVTCGQRQRLKPESPGNPAVIQATASCLGLPLMYGQPDSVFEVRAQADPPRQGTRWATALLSLHSSSWPRGPAPGLGAVADARLPSAQQESRSG